MVHSLHLRSLSKAVALAAMFFISTPFASARDGDVFVSPPFIVGETVAGIGGWEMRHGPDYPIYNDPEAARLIDTTVIGSSQPTTLELKTALKKSGFLKPGGRTVVETCFAVTFQARYYQGGGLYYQFSAAPEGSPLVFGFDMGKTEGDGGLYVQGEGDRVIILPRHLIAEQSAYTFVVGIDLMNETFTVSVKGTDISGEPFSYESEEMRFQEGFKYSERPLDLFMGNNYPTLIGAYVDYVKTTDTP